MKSYVLAFSHIWPCCTKRSRSTQGHHLNNLGSTWVTDATYIVPRPLVHWFWRRRFLKVFTIYRHGGHLGHVTKLTCTNFHSHSPISFHMNFGFKWPACFWEKQVLILKSEWPLAKVKKWPWPLILITSFINSFECLNQLWSPWLQYFQRIHKFHLCPCKSLSDKIWPWC